ncbi:MAG: hypothetical protein KatS3mg032_1539 [Cyclobacteriaceae bacterium]|nr:MAG: hypothetical protein KatS3mg032_1539 [Cyclobacteriaceae bacterium]
MKPIILVLAVLMACAGRQQQNEDQVGVADAEPDLPATFQGYWEKLTQWPNGQWVVYRPCDADNPSLTFQSDTLVIGWGQDASIAVIDNIKADEIPGRFVLAARDEGVEALVYYLEWEDDEKTLLRVWLYGPDEAPEVYARADVLENYDLFEQPCHECWEDCDEVEGEIEEIE